MASLPPPPPPGWQGASAPGAPLQPPPPGYRPPADPQQAKFEQKKKEWLRIQKNRFGEKRKNGFVDTHKADMPPEHLRKIVRDIGDVSQKKFSADKRAYLGALKFMVCPLPGFFFNFTRGSIDGWVLTGRDCAASRGFKALGKYADAVGECTRSSSAVSRQRVLDTRQRDPACHRAGFPRAMGDDVGVHEEGKV